MTHIELKGYGFAQEKITVSTTAIGPTAATRAPAGEAPAKAALVTIITQPVRLWTTGTNPDSSTGIRLAANDTMLIVGEANVSQLRMIREGGSDATANIQYLR